MSKRFILQAIALLLTCAAAPAIGAATGQGVQDRIDAGVAAGKPIVVHVVVALCDNANQGIVPVSETLGNGQNPRTNLYWGALYGLRTHFQRAAGWTRISATKPDDVHVLERAVLFTEIKRGEVSVPVYVVADAWDGAHIREAIQAFLGMAAGQLSETIELSNGSTGSTLRAGGSAHLLAYVGHNGLMEFSLDAPTRQRPALPARSAIVLACTSKPYFLEHLQAADAHPLLLTTGLLAPEAYTLDSAIRSWIADATAAGVRDAAARAYDNYQKCGYGAARRLFWGAP